MRRILITGGSGLVGSALKKILPEITSVPSNTIAFYPTRKHLNLLDKTEVNFTFGNFNPTHIIHLAAKVGGLKANMTYVSDFYHENTVMNINVLEAAKNCGAKLLSMLSTCVYPDSKYVVYPLTEEQLHFGPPHESNFGYAYAKRMLDVQSRAYRKQYGCNFITVIPNNLFGSEDNYDLENGHVIPSLIRKIWEAKIFNLKEVEIWGTGKPLREFTYHLDAARIMDRLLISYNGPEPINIGNTEQYSISTIAKSIKSILDYGGELYFNADKPDGQYRKPSSNKKLMLNTFWSKEDYTPFNIALRETCEWFKNNYPNIRGI